MSRVMTPGSLKPVLPPESNAESPPTTASSARSFSKRSSGAQTPRKVVMTNAYIERPEGSPLAKNTRGQTTAMLAGLAVLKDSKLEKAARAEGKGEHRIMQTPIGESAISAKEEALELIMSREAKSGFDHMGRYLLDRSHVTRVAIDPTRLARPPDHAEGLLTGDDVAPGPDPDLDPSLVDRWGLDCWRSSPEEAEQAPPWASELCGLRFGFGFGPPPAPQGRGAARIAEPSLDRAFAARCGEHLLVGVANGHGHPRHAANLAELIAERLPEAVFQSPPLAQQGDAAGALIWAFHRVHREAAEALSLELAGAACTVALLDRERVWVAHVGDCRALLATPDPQPNAAQFHFVGSVLTQDHKLSVKAEFDRMQDFGGEMRKLVNDGVYRLFVPNDEVPGLTLTRAIGDRLGHEAGVIHTPSVCCFHRGEVHGDAGNFLLLGSGGLWATMSERVVVNWVGRFFDDAAEAAGSLSIEAASRWEEPHSVQKQSLRHGLADCFATALIFFDPVDTDGAVPRSLPPPRPPAGFVLGPHSDKSLHRDWREVCHKDRSVGLRRAQARLLPTQDLVSPW